MVQKYLQPASVGIADEKFGREFSRTLMGRLCSVAIVRGAQTLTIRSEWAIGKKRLVEK